MNRLFEISKSESMIDSMVVQNFFGEWIPNLSLDKMPFYFLQ